MFGCWHQRWFNEFFVEICLLLVKNVRNFFKQNWNEFFVDVEMKLGQTGMIIINGLKLIIFYRKRRTFQNATLYISQGAKHIIQVAGLEKR